MDIQKKRHFVRGLGAIAAVLGLFAGSAAAQSTMVVALGTDHSGGPPTTAGRGVAKIVTQRSPVTVRVRAYGGPEIWLPQLDDGSIQLGAHFSATAWLSYNAIDTKVKLDKMRILRSSGAAG